ncbi:hypothetical protein T02_8898 [Trichinella nativa]|uniref:Uncharacterized protein n=1 Tax=Trichinella nativa TaxID=6335 RepID=A0A0V1LJL0_9BILA|nr:hypothetical protein T02_8898 [Trichinella nativa]
MPKKPNTPCIAKFIHSEDASTSVLLEVFIDTGANAFMMIMMVMIIIIQEEIKSVITQISNMLKKKQLEKLIIFSLTSASHVYVENGLKILHLNT